MHVLDAVLLIGVIFVVLSFIIRTGLFSKEEKRDDDDVDSSVIILKVCAVIVLIIVLYNYL